MADRLDIAPEYRPWLDAIGLRTLDDFFDWQAGECLSKPGLEPWRQRWRMQLKTDAGSSRTLYLKRFDHPPLARQWARWREGGWRTSTAGVEWNNAQALQHAGIAAARVVAFGERLQGPMEVRSFALLEEVKGESLEGWLPRALPPAKGETNWQRRRERLDALATFIARFHDAGFVHRDLYLAHVFLDEDHDDSIKLTLIDLQRVFRPRWRGRRWVVKDLAALNYSTPADRVGTWERLRFVCRYVQTCKRWGAFRELVRAVETKTARMSKRRQPPLADERIKQDDL